ncbi:MAG: hypothetical protein RL490_1391 [Pseudomonadota bacterium]
MTPARPEADASPMARLLGGGRLERLAILWEPPPALPIGDTSHFERVVRLLRPGQQATAFAGHAVAVADPQRLPFIEAVFDRLLVTSTLPSATARAELRELWRVMAPAALGLLIIKARRPWQWTTPGWLEDDLRPLLDDLMFEVHDWQVETLPNRHHVILVGKRDGLRAAPIGAAEHQAVTATA